MVVQHNLQAMNANRMLNITTSGLSKTTEKLASGYRINRAADDAAGLAISEKMRKQIRGIEQASANAQDGISCVQTAEGAMAEVEDMLQRMNQLTVQAANGTNSVSDRQAIQDEIDQLVDEIDRIAETSKFNETYLLKGATDGGTQMLEQYAYKEYIATTFGSEFEGGATYYSVNADGSDPLADGTDIYDYVGIDENGELAFKKPLYKYSDDDQMWHEVTDLKYVAQAITYSDELGNEVPADDLPLTGLKLAEFAENKFFIEEDDGTRKYITNANIEEYLEVDTTDPANPTLAFKNENEVKVVEDGTVIDAADATEVGAFELGNPELYDVDGNRISSNGLAKILVKDTAIYELYIGTGQSLADIGVKDDGKVAYINSSQHAYPDKLEILLQVGSDGTYENKLPVEIESMGAVNLGVDILKSDKNGIVDEDGMLATDAIDVIAAAINKVSAQRASLGAIQNRLEHTINNLDNVAENTTAAESQIRDTDMASEMVKYSNTNILSQAGQSMLAQANQANQGVLSLLQG
ncbi:MAG: flagellar hook protein [Lachnospiraceae bacterium]|nr:flagellar hook protein [Lachnospiraceae bacterium]